MDKQEIDENYDLSDDDLDYFRIDYYSIGIKNKNEF